MNQEKNIPRVVYQIFVPSFCDSNQDGVGDLKGIQSKLDYLQDLGVEAIWLSPIFLSSSYHKYDVIDYYKIDGNFGTEDDLVALIQDAAARKIQVYLDLVMNHTSSQHVWFQDAQRNEDSPYRDFYIWKSPEKIRQERLEEREATADSGLKDPWHWPVQRAKEKYYSLFWREMPHLNLANPATKQALLDVALYWLQRGVAGFRLDAAKHIFSDELKAAHFWKVFSDEVRRLFPAVYFVGEVWTSAERVAPFFEGLTANFDFQLSDEIKNIVKLVQISPSFIPSLQQRYNLFASFNTGFVDATFLSNHDQERVASFLDNDKEKLKAVANILFTLPGQPYIYYGEELGMLGKKPDERIREAFLWDERSKDSARTNWQKPKYNTDSKVRPLAQQKIDEQSIYTHYKNWIKQRKETPSLAQVSPVNLLDWPLNIEGIMSFQRTHCEGDTYVLHNLTNEAKAIPQIREEEWEIKYKTPQQSVFHDKILCIAPWSCVVLSLKNRESELPSKTNG